MGRDQGGRRKEACGAPSIAARRVRVTRLDTHYFPYDETGTRAYHCAPATCHVGLFLGFCSAHHDGCGGLAGPSSVDVDAFLNSARGILELALHDGVVYNVDRNALQVIGCDGRPSANVPVPEAERNAVMLIRAAVERHLV